MHEASGSLVLCQFGQSPDPLELSASTTQQENYLRCYLIGLSAKSTLIEPTYFDRDYLAEFSAFYAQSARGYRNACRRAHYFSVELLSSEIDAALGGDLATLEKLQGAYLGFIVVRPIPCAPLGRTVLRWYEDRRQESTPRNTVQRKYQCNIAGIRLTVDGLAWQQQDSAIASCATISLWTMLHSSAFDDLHAVPTTVAITQAAHKTASLGSRIFPSQHLTQFQMLEAIKEQGLAPDVRNGNLPGGYFSPETFSIHCATLIRSGYPVLIAARMLDGTDGDVGHAVCGVGFRESELGANGYFYLKCPDSEVDVIYINDDNIGPNIRFKIQRVTYQIGSHAHERAILRQEQPSYINADARTTHQYPDLAPVSITVAMHEGVRISTGGLIRVGYELTSGLEEAVKVLAEEAGSKIDREIFVFGAKITRSADYMHEQLHGLLAGNPSLLAKARRELFESAPPLSLHVGVVRIAAVNDSSVLMDVLYDTTDSERNVRAFAHIVYSEAMQSLLESVAAAKDLADQIGPMGTRLSIY